MTESGGVRQDVLVFGCPGYLSSLQQSDGNLGKHVHLEVSMETLSSAESIHGLV